LTDGLFPELPGGKSIRKRAPSTKQRAANFCASRLQNHYSEFKQSTFASVAENPPVPIDNAMILRKVAPAFDREMRKLGGDPNTIGAWNDPADSWVGYNCYMTAISCWAEKLRWSTTEVECTLFRQYGTGP